ncbi:linear amide C-N hydrolase [Photobacterium satsumensis]|uniref:linear amide C-N hydrolase n=1 Tax=Photobacterium satsumensis TaxID=2910239 RepID=UPI003D0F1866
MCSALGLIATENTVLGVNYDFLFDHGLVVLNPRHVNKCDKLPLGKRLYWKSLYGSVTLVQFGCELPSGGMNEMGLSIHLLEQRDAVYPPLDKSERVLSELQWIQYQLDMSQSVKDVVASLEHVKLQSHFIDLHYVVADSVGQAAVIEFVDGQIEVTRYDAGHSLVLTNHSLAKCKLNQGEAGKIAESASLSRFFQLKDMSSSYQQCWDPESFIFNCLNDVAIAGKQWESDSKLNTLRGVGRFRTCWQVLFFPAKKTMKFNHYANGNGFEISLADWDFSVIQSRMSGEFNLLPSDGEKLNLTRYTQDENRRIVETSYQPYRRYFPDQFVEEIVRFPDEFMLSE